MASRKEELNVRYQVGFLVKLCVVLIISSFISGVIFYNFVNYDIGGSYTNSKFVIRSVNDFLFPSLWFSITILTLLLSFGTIVISILVSHKIAGPLYRLEKTIGDFKSGIFYKISLRPDDQVKGLVSSLNEFVDYLSNRFSTIKTHSLNVKSLIREGKKACDEGGADYQRLIRIQEKLKDETRGIKEIIAAFKTE